MCRKWWYRFHVSPSTPAIPHHRVSGSAPGIQWRIYIVTFRTSVPSRSKFLHVISAKFSQIIGWRPQPLFLGWHFPPPTSRECWIRSWNCQIDRDFEKPLYFPSGSFRFFLGEMKWVAIESTHTYTRTRTYDILFQVLCPIKSLSSRLTAMSNLTQHMIYYIHSTVRGSCDIYSMVLTHSWSLLNKRLK